MKQFALLAALLVSSCGSPTESPSHTGEAWDDRNLPSAFGASADTPFDQLPLSAVLPATPWSDDYWPTRQGGISARWHDAVRNQRYTAYLYDFPTSSALQSFDRVTLDKLSPAEKLDLLHGRSDLPLAHGERNRMLASVRGGDVPAWHGLCHGWAQAAYNEPQAKHAIERMLPDGRKITFYPSDIHALMTKFYGDYHAGQTADFLGARCSVDNNGRSADPACRDANAGSFHLAVIEALADQHRPFIAELDQGEQIWNHPVYGYQTELSNFRVWRRINDAGRYRFRAPGTVYLVDVQMRLEYVSEALPANGVQGPVRRAVVYEYSLELDANKRIIGGEWHTSHPDFLWRTSRHPAAGDVRGNLDYAEIRNLLDQAQ